MNVSQMDQNLRKLYNTLLECPPQLRFMPEAVVCFSGNFELVFAQCFMLGAMKLGKSTEKEDRPVR